MSLILDLRSLRAGDRVLLQNLRLDVPAGAIHTVMGPSGCGKSTLLAALCGTLAPGQVFDGTIELNGRRIDTLPTRQRRVGILFQEDMLFAHMTVLENLLFALPAAKAHPDRPTGWREAAARDALASVEMSAFADADPATLSGGQRGRVALMRALLAEPQALLLDEPFAKLDAALRDRMRELVFELLRARGLPTLLVTHDVEDVADPASVYSMTSA
ncbi:MAG: hypothetical protein RLZZ126_696 [Pseudomonadota bacterium]|jgi:putative thiamine transport system ATP-binding protein